MTIDMPFGRRLAVAVLLPLAGLAALAGCARDDQTADGIPGSSPAGPAPSATAPVTATATAQRITLEKSGGIAGVRETLVIEPDGTWTRTGKTGAATSGRLTSAQLAQLQTAVAGADLRSGSLDATGTARCADAFLYRLSVGAASITYSDCPGGSAPAAAKTLATLLTRMTT